MSPEPSTDTSEAHSNIARGSSDETLELVVAARSSGRSFTEIGKLAGVDERTVRRWYDRSQLGDRVAIQRRDAAENLHEQFAGLTDKLQRVLDELIDDPDPKGPASRRRTLLL